MKSSKYTVTVVDNETGEQVLDFDISDLNYKVKANTNSDAKLYLNGTCLLDESKSEPTSKIYPFLSTLFCDDLGGE